MFNLNWELESAVKILSILYCTCTTMLFVFVSVLCFHNQQPNFKRVVVPIYPWFKFYFPLFLGMVTYSNEFEAMEVSLLLFVNWPIKLEN